jgi:hypothetical protein
MERDSHTIVQRQIDDDLRNAQAFLFYDATDDILRNEQQPIVLCEECGQHTHGERDGELVVGDCENCGEQFAYSKDDARVVAE